MESQPSFGSNCKISRRQNQLDVKFAKKVIFVIAQHYSGIEMKWHSLYLEWYVKVPTVKFDFRSSGLAYLKLDLTLGEVDLSVNYAHGNPETAKLLARRYGVEPKNVFISSDGASGQNVRIIMVLAEKSRKKEAVVEYPTYEPLLRQVQEYFPRVKRLERKAEDGYRLDADALREVVSDKTGLLVITNPHAPSGAVATKSDLSEVMAVAKEYGFYVLCDEIYAEFERVSIQTAFSIDEEFGITTTSFSKAYGLGGLRLGVALASEKLVDELYADTLGTIGNSSNMVQFIAAKLLRDDIRKLEGHKLRWSALKRETEEWLDAKEFEYFQNKFGITYWVKTPIKDTYKWVNETAIPKHCVAPVPGAFFLFKSGYTIVNSSMIRLGLGNINPENPNLQLALEALWKAING
ncbi:MAG: pyridoxal phosphate-dependent aminotransferase [Candidatus Bathyarchaeia archaeon]